MATEIGFDSKSVTEIATAVSQLSRSILQYARSGEIFVEPISRGGRRGVSVTARHDGPRNGESREKGSYTATGALFESLSRIGNLMDEYTIRPAGEGGEIIARKWV
ncbi:MAG: ATP-binding protein [Chloroflexi bacterium]|nr:ATP-binding protein [Chloroflexota bacterium]